MIGELKYCTDAKTKKIFMARVVGVNITDNGYDVYRVLLSDNTTKVLEKSHIHETPEEASKYLDRVTPLMNEADKLIREATDKVDAIRLQVIGKPLYTEIAENMKGTK